MAEFGSGIIKVEQLNGGLFRTATPSSIPENSFSDMKNFDIEDSGISTRKGLTRSNTNPFYPECLQFGYSDAQRVNYLQAGGGDYGPQTPSTTRDSWWEGWVLAKESTSTTAHRTLLSVLDSDENLLIELYWFDDRLRANVRPTSSDSFLRVSTGAGSEYIPRTGTTNNIYGIRINSQVGGTVQVEVTDFTNTTSVIDSNNYGVYTWETGDNLIVGCDENLSNPSTDWSSSSNNAFYGTMGEVAIARGRPTAPNLFKYYKNGTMDSVLYDQRVCYYPLQKDFDDKWGLSQSFADASYITGTGLSSYSVEDSDIEGSRDILYCTKSWRVNTYDKDRYVFGQSNSLGSRFRDYMTGTSSAYAWTFDILPVRMGTSTTSFEILTSTTAGPQIRLDYSSAGKSLIKFKHDYGDGTEPEITHAINNNFVSKITCEYTNPGTTATLNIYQDTMLVSSTVAATATTVTSAGNLRLGMDTTTAVSADFFMSGLVFHDTNAGSVWGDRPQESYEDVTTYKKVRKRRKVRLWGGSASYKTSRRVAKVSVEKTGNDPMAPSLFDLPLFSNVRGAYLFTEVSGYDTAGASDPHGILRNIFSSSTTDGSDLILKNSASPTWKVDRNAQGLVTTNFQGDVYERDADGVYGYIPVNSNLGERILILRNSQLLDDSGNVFILEDNYGYTIRKSAKSRGFMYGNSFFYHNENHYLRFNGNEVRPCEHVTPSIPMTLTPDSSPGSGLNGAYKYAYTTTDKSGIESYPTLPVSTTVKTGNIAVALNSKISTSSYMFENVQYITVYRNKGGTTSTTNLDRDADRSLFKLKRIPLSAVISNASGTLFTDTTADSALGEDAPQQGDAEPMPPCKYSTIFKDVAIFTGNELSPDTYYQSGVQQPELLGGEPSYDEFLTEDGEKNVGIASVGTGFIVFKNTSRKYVRGFIGGDVYEFHNGGCMSHDSLITIGNNIYGLGSNGFFKTDGHNYTDITDTYDRSGRNVSSVRGDVEGWTDAIKGAAYARYHEPTKRYICYVNNKVYILDLRYNVWTKYEDVVGKPLAYKNDQYFFAQGWLYKEVGTQSHVATTRVRHSVASGTTGSITVVSTTALPTTNTFGLPMYVGTTFHWISNIVATGTTHTITTATTENFANATEMTLGIMNAQADTKYFQARTPNRNKWFKKTMIEHNNQSGELAVRYARNNGDFDNSFDDYLADTSIEKVQNIVRLRSENMSMRMAREDGNPLKLRNYQISYTQDSDR